MAVAELTEKQRAEEISSWRWRLCRLGIKESHFADMCGRHQASMSRWISGTSRPCDETFAYIKKTIEKLEKSAKKK